MVECVAQKPVCPAHALPEQRFQCARCCCVHRSGRSIRDEIPCRLYPKCQFHVLGRVPMPPAAEFFQYACAENREWAGSDEYGTKIRENESIKYREAIFNGLDVLQKGSMLAHVYGGSYRGDLHILKDRNDGRERTRRHDRIRV